MNKYISGRMISNDIYETIRYNAYKAGNQIDGFPTQNAVQNPVHRTMNDIKNVIFKHFSSILITTGVVYLMTKFKK